MKHEKYVVTGMSCAVCSGRVEKAVSALDGTKNVVVNLLTNSMQLDYDETKVTPQDIINAVVAAGYGASPESAPGEAATSAAPALTPKDINAQEAKEMKHRLVWSIIFLIPTMYIAMHHMFL